MSLLDDVSIVVTPNGYKAGELYAVVPVPTEGAEILSQPVDLVTDFIVNSGGVIVDADTFDTFGGTYDGIRKNSCFTVGKRYKLTIQGDTTSSGFTIGDTSGSGNQYGSGFGTFYFTALGNGSLWIRQQTPGTTNITSFTVKEYTSADMDVTRATAATRVDENGLVNYAEIIGDELVADGSFPTGTSEWGTGTGVTVGSGVATFTSTPSGQSVQQNAVATALPNGSLAKVSFEVLSRTEGSFGLYFSGTLVGSRSSVGVFTAYFTKGTQTSFYIRALGTTSGTISNVSVIEEVRNNVPRIDYTGGGCPHILAEPQRTNLIPYSEDFGQTSWQKQTGIVPTYNTTETLSPDGTYNATKFIGTGSTGVFKSSVIVSGNITRSVYLKSVSGTTTAVFKDPNATGGATPVSLTITNDWQRFELTGDNGTGFQGLWIDDITSDGLYMWGAQLEQGSYATSYIPNFGTVAGVTRVQDIFTRDGIGSLINSAEGVLFVEMAALSNDSTRRTISLSDGTNTNRVVLRYDNASNRVQGFIQVGGATNGNINDNSYTITNFLKIAYKWKAGDFALWINGTEVAVSTSATSFGAGVLTEMQFNEGDGAGKEYFGKVKQLQVYTTALTDEQLTSLTS